MGCRGPNFRSLAPDVPGGGADELQLSPLVFHGELVTDDRCRETALRAQREPLQRNETARRHYPATEFFRRLQVWSLRRLE